MLFGIMPEGTIGDFEELRGPRANATGFLEGRLQVHPLGSRDDLFKIHAVFRQFDALSSSQRRSRITQDPVGQDSHGNLLARLQGHGALHGVFKFSHVPRPVVGFELAHRFRRNRVYGFLHRFAEALREDIPLLARHFLERFRKTMEKPIDAISPEAMSKLEAYDWPGNVRELENTMERAVALETGKEISVRVLPDRILGYAGTPLGAAEGIELPEDGVDFEKVVAATERMYLQAALEKAGGVRTRASEFLKITYRSFRHYAKKHSL